MSFKKGKQVSMPDFSQVLEILPLPTQHMEESWISGFSLRRTPKKLALQRHLRPGFFFLIFLFSHYNISNLLFCCPWNSRFSLGHSEGLIKTGYFNLHAQVFLHCGEMCLQVSELLLLSLSVHTQICSGSHSDFYSSY
jgi:hypothetical protein